MIHKIYKLKYTQCSQFMTWIRSNLEDDENEEDGEDEENDDNDEDIQ